ncbi:MAG TPA: endopeptidase, partial [Thermoanaerobaculia bacterium]
MWKDSRRLLVVSGLLGLLVGDPARAVKPKEPGDYLNQKEFFKPELYISSSHEGLAEVVGSLPNRQAWESFLEAHELKGGGPVQAYIDPRSGAATNLIGAFPLIPGRGVGNQVTLEELGARLGRPVETVDAATVTDAVAAFVRGHADILGVSPAQLGAVRSVEVNRNLWQVSIEQTYNGIPVRHGRLAASISHGNLVVIGTETWGDVRGLSTAATVSAADALTTGFSHAGGRSAQDEIRRQPALEILPVAPQEHQKGEGFAGPVGAGYRHLLVWTFVFQRRPEHALWEVIVDAHSGELLAFQDINQYASHTISGGVYPLTNTEICPNAATCGTMQSGWPMPFADTGLASPNDFTNSAGVFNWTSGTVTTTLSGKYVNIFDNCGAVNQTSASGSINMGGINGQHDCTSIGSAGNTASSRSAYYEINKVAEQARGWLPANAWLQSQLPTNVNISDVCNAYYDFSSINFFRSGSG